MRNVSIRSASGRKITLACLAALSATILLSAGTMFGFSPMSGLVQYAEAHQDVTAPGGTTGCTTIGFNPSLAVKISGVDVDVFTQSDIGKTAEITLTLSDTALASDCSIENDFTQGGPTTATLSAPNFVPQPIADAANPILCIGGNNPDPQSLNPNNCAPGSTRVSSQTLLPATWVVNPAECGPTLKCEFNANVPVFPHRNVGDIPLQNIAVITVIPFSSTNLTKTANPTNGTAPLTVTYTYNETNDGGADIYDPSVTDDKCAPVTYVSGDLNADVILNPGESWIFTCVTTYTTAGTYTNTADAHGFTGPVDEQSRRDLSHPEDPDERATATVEVFPAPDLTILKECEPTSQIITDSTGTITWTITVINGPAAQDVIVSDTRHGPIPGLSHAYSANETDTEVIPEFLGPGSYSDTATAIGSLSGTVVSNTPTCTIIKPVGGEILPTDVAALLVAGALPNAAWILPTVAAIAAISIGFLKFGARRF